jgi:hypothetical protein
VSHLAFHPRTDALLLAAGDKDGKVALWHPLFASFPSAGAPATPAGTTPLASPSKMQSRKKAEAKEEEDVKMEGDEEEGKKEEGGVDFESDHGVMLFDIHTQYISGLK